MSNARFGLRTRNGSISGIIQGLPTNLLLNSYPADAAFSLRRLNVNYLGSCIRVRRSSDNAEQDIGFVNSELDTASLLSFVGIGNNGFVTTWYDQSGVIRNATQTTAANQPQIVFNGVINLYNGKPAIFTDGINDSLQINPMPAFAYFDCYYALNTNDTVYAYPATPSSLVTYGFNAVVGSTDTIIVRSYGSPQLYANNTLFTGTTKNDVYNFLNGYKLVVHQGASINSTLWSNFSIIGFHQPFQGNVHEIIYYSTNQSANRTAIQSNINSYYNIY